MKVIFLLGNLYLHAAPFERIRAILREDHIEASLYYVGDECPWCSRKSALVAGWEDVKKPPIYGIRTDGSIVARAAQFAKVLINRKSIMSFLRREAPDVLITGGDITNINTRLFLDISDRLRIKTILVPIVMPGPAVMNPDHDKSIPYARFVRSILRCLDLERTIFFRDWIIGSYARHAWIAVSSGDVKQELMQHGISGERIEVTGNPGDDLVYDVLAMDIHQLRSSIYNMLMFSDDFVFIIYCTEIIQDVYGMPYLKEINAVLLQAFNALPENCRVVIKLHPREPLDITEYYEKIFAGERYRIIKNEFDIKRLMRLAKVVIAHYSAVLSDAALLGATVLSIRLTPDDQIPVRFDDINSHIHIQTDKEIKDKLLEAVSETSPLVTSQKETIRQWIQKKGLHCDGKNARRVADLIKKQMATVNTPHP